MKRPWWERISDEMMRLVYQVRDPKAARTRARRSEGAKRGWAKRRAKTP